MGVHGRRHGGRRLPLGHLTPRSARQLTAGGHLKVSHMPTTPDKECPQRGSPRPKAGQSPEARAKKDFRVFLAMVWHHLNLPSPTPVQYDLAAYMQHGPRRKVIFAYRGVGKTWIYAAYVCWRLLNNPNAKIMVVSGSSNYAADFTRFVKRLISEMPILQHLAPGDDQRSSGLFFDVGPATASKDPSVKSVGIFGQLAGSRADEILADDVETMANSSTEGARTKLSEAVKEFDAILKPGGSVTFLGTPQSFMSFYLALPERGYDMRIWPARVPSNVDAYVGRLAPFILRMIDQGVPAGTPVDPLRFTDEDLLERERSYGPGGFALQFMLNSSLNDAMRFPLKLADLIVSTLDPQRAPLSYSWCNAPEKAVGDLQAPGLPGDALYYPMWQADAHEPYSGSMMAIDPSGRGEDETAYAVTKHLLGNIFLVDIGGFQTGYSDETLDALVSIAKRHSVNLIRVESNFGDGMFSSLLRAAAQRVGYKVTIEEKRSVGQKELRIIDTLEPVIAAHRLIVDKAAIRGDAHVLATDPVRSLFWQMTRLTRDRGAIKHDDRLDALTLAVGYWTEQMAQENGKQAEKAKDKALAEALKRHMRHLLRIKGPAPKKGWGRDRRAV